MGLCHEITRSLRKEVIPAVLFLCRQRPILVGSVHKTQQAGSAVLRVLLVALLVFAPVLVFLAVGHGGAFQGLGFS